MTFEEWWDEEGKSVLGERLYDHQGLQRRVVGQAAWRAATRAGRERCHNRLIPIQLSDSPDKGTPPPDVQNGEWCLVWYCNAWWAGRFVKMRDSFWNFHDMYGKPWQYDKPGYNASQWPDTIWRIVTAVREGE